MIFVTVGSALPFDRLVQFLDERLSAETGIEETFFAQIGSGHYVPSNFESIRYLRNHRGFTVAETRRILTDGVQALLT